MLIYVSSFMFFISLFSFSMNRKHLLSVLLSLELISLSLYFLLVNYLSMFNYESFFLMVFLTFTVCEGSLGLSILISMIRTYGNDNYSSFNILW